MFRWVAGIIWNYGIGSGRFSVDVEGKRNVFSSNGDVKETDFVVSFFFDRIS
jgi:hypothetical protein